MIKITPAERRKLNQIHPDLRAVVEEYLATGTVPVVILEAKRSLAQQKKNIEAGVSWTLKSRHLDGHAIDIAPKVNGKATFAWPPYYPLAKQMKAAAKRVGVPVEWGGDWVKTKDGPHWQLPWKLYPAGDGTRRAPVRETTVNEVRTTKTLALAASGGSGAGVSLGDTISNVSTAVSSQQYELTSGDYVRIAIAVGILVLTGVGIWLTWKDK